MSYTSGLERYVLRKVDKELSAYRRTDEAATLAALMAMPILAKGAKKQGRGRAAKKRLC